MDESTPRKLNQIQDESFEFAVLLARIDALSKQRLTAFLWNILIMTVCVSFLWATHSSVALLAWWSVNTIFSAWRINDWRLTRQQLPTSSAAAKRWLRQVTVASAMGGMIWGFGAWSFIEGQHVPTMVFFLLTLLSVANGGIISYAAHLPAGLVFAFPIALTASARLLYLDFDYSHFIALGSLVAFSFMLAVAKNYAGTVTHALTLHIENTQLLAEANQQKSRAEAANQDKSRFFAAISHDLRQPLYAMGLVLESLGERLRDPELRILHTDLAKMHDALTEMFDAALDVSRLDSGAMPVNLRDVELNEILETLYNEFSQEAARKNIKLDYQDSTAWLQSDRLMFMRIMRNLLSNAIRYNHNGYVNIRVEQLHNGVEIEIEDDGEGIPESAQKKIFAEYFQVHNEARRRSEGLGIGLAIVERLCRLLEIEISFESKPGHGTTFRLKVPSGASVPPEISEGKAVFHRFGGLHALVIDDDPLIRTSLQRLLQDHDCVVTLATNANEALLEITAQKRPVDILLCDYRLGDEVDGFSEITRLRTALDPELPAILVTGDTAPEIEQRAKRENVGLLLKPIKPAVLFDMILAEV